MTSPVIAYINSHALLHNLSIAKKHAPKAKVIAMVKANAYGHGLENIAPVLQEHVDAFAVARLDPALQLRSLNITKPIVIMAGFYLPEQLKVMSANNFETLVHNQSQIDLLNNTELASPITVWLKVDTGMSRLGFMPNEVPNVYQQLQQCTNVAKVGLMTHFPDADDVTKPVTNNQVTEFMKLLPDLDIDRSLAKSAGVIAYPDSHADTIRPGVMLYGASPLMHKTADQLNLKPVMTLKAPVIALRQLKKGAAVGYGGTFVCPEDMQIGVIGVGYGDGYPRHAKPGTPILLNGKRVPLIGRVCMDMLMVDLRDCSNVSIGDKATLWGDGLPAGEVALCAGTIPYDLFCGVSKRVQFEMLTA